MKEIIKDGLILSISAMFTALAVKLFFSEYALTPGGITGLAITLSSLFKLPVSAISFMISMPLLIISTLFLGGKFGIKTLFVTLMIPFFMSVIPAVHVIEFPIVAAILGGVLIGISISLAIQRKCATGGTDIIAMLLHLALKHVDIPVILFVLDMMIVMSSWLISKDFMTSLYSALSLFIIMQTIRLCNKGGNDEKRCFH